MQAFREAIEKRDLESLAALFADDILFRSPAVYAPYHGREQVKQLLGTVMQVVEDFHYTRQLESSDAADHALVFRTRIGDRDVEGCDFLHINQDGLIDEFYVMMRPLSGLTALAEAVSRQMGLDASRRQPAGQAIS